MVINQRLQIQIRFYEKLNDFLPKAKQKVSFSHLLQAKTAIKDIIESLGVPHTEVDLILVNGKSVNFAYQPQLNDYISVYPVFELLDISQLTHLRPKPLRISRFICDVHLGKLTRYLRLLGLDTIYQNNADDKQIIQSSIHEKRIILTRDLGLLKNKIVTHGYWLRHSQPKLQLLEVIEKFDLKLQCQPFSRCIDCNGLMMPIDKQKIVKYLPPLTKKYYHQFYQCSVCKKVYWQGTHYQKLKNFVNTIINDTTN